LRIVVRWQIASNDSRKIGEIHHNVVCRAEILISKI